MTLTPRQLQFYQALEALCRIGGRSVHYTALAEALGVSPFSAYDMLKVLESKGAVASEYVLDPDAAGPGRSAIMFYPRARPACQPGPSSSPEEAEWSRLRQRLLQRLAEVRDTNVPDVLSELLSRLSEYTSPLSYCTGVIAALLVNLRASRRELFQRRQRRALRALVSGGEVGLGTLAGLSIGSSLERLRETPRLESLLESARRFQIHLSALSLERRQRLADFLRDALSAIETTQA